MNQLLNRASLARVLPFFLFMAALALRGNWPPSAAWLDPRWIYGLGVLVVGGTLFAFWPEFKELAKDQRLGWMHALLSVVVGLVVFELWINLTEPWMILGQPSASFRPVDDEGHIMWGLVVVRWIGAALLVPVMEELFWRSFLMRWIDNPEFDKVDPKQVTIKAMALSTFAFMLVHTFWLGAILAGLAYAWLYKRTGSLWAPIVAHAVTNGVLGLWVVVWGNWQFW